MKMSFKKMKSDKRLKYVIIMSVIVIAILVVNESFLQTEYTGALPLDGMGTLEIDVQDGTISTAFTMSYQSITDAYLTLNAYLYEDGIKVATGIPNKGEWTYSFIFDYDTSYDAVYKIEYKGILEPPDVNIHLSVGQISDAFVLEDYEPYTETNTTTTETTTTTTTTGTEPPPPHESDLVNIVILVGFGLAGVVTVMLIKRRNEGYM